MKKKVTLFFFVIAASIMTTGCWDSVELNNLALVMGWGVDKTDNGFEASAQIANPVALGTGQSAGKQTDNKYFVVTTESANVQEAVSKMQKMLSRKITPGHRRVIYIGESLAKSGLQNAFDEYTRNPDVRFRTDVFVVKNGTARDILNMDYPFERNPTIGALKIHKTLGGSGDFSLLDFLIALNDETSYPTLPLLKRGTMQPPSVGVKALDTYSFGGRAIFNKNLKMIGELDSDEASYRRWIISKLQNFNVTFKMPEGTVSIKLDHLHSHITTRQKNGKMTFNILLYGNGAVLENATPLDLSNSRNVSKLNLSLENVISQRATRLIRKTQQQFHSDIFYFGHDTQIDYPIQWEMLSKDWERRFTEANVIVTSHISVSQLGTTMKSLVNRNNEGGGT